MLKTVILLCLINSPKVVYAFDLSSIIDSAELAKDAQAIVLNLGLNCGQPQNIPQFINEIKSLVEGLSSLSAEMSLQVANKKDFPSICHVLSQAQLSVYSEGKETTNDKACISHAFGKCLKWKYIKKERPLPVYWWPKYFIEVTEKGNDSDATFSGNNKLYSLNRKLANHLSTLVDEAGAVKITSYVMGGNAILSSIGIKTGEVNPAELGRTAILTPLEKLRFRGSKSKTQSTFDVNLWPVAHSKTFAKALSVCGPELSRKGQHPGGYSWSAEGVPMTCPIAMSSDAYAYWDTGMLDYVDPEVVASMAIGSNSLTCGMAQGSEFFNQMDSNGGNKIGDQKEIDNVLGSQSTENQSSLKSCSWPILGASEAIAKKSLSLVDAKKWKQVKCTLWGSVAPRTSSSVYSNDFSYANAALKFKLLAHEMFGVPQGEKERWSLAYPWEGKNSEVTTTALDPDSLTNGISSTLKKLKINPSGDAEGSSRSESLLIVGSPKLINLSKNNKFIQDRVTQIGREFAYIGAMTQVGGIGFLGAEIARMKAAQNGEKNIIGGDRRIYTIWEKISCRYPSIKITEDIKPLPSISFYDSCTSAMRLEVYKYVQLKLIRKICDSIGEVEGKPWK